MLWAACLSELVEHGGKVAGIETCLGGCLAPGTGRGGGGRGLAQRYLGLLLRLRSCCSSWTRPFALAL